MESYCVGIFVRLVVFFVVRIGFLALFLLRTERIAKNAFRLSGTLE